MMAVDMFCPIASGGLSTASDMPGFSTGHSSAMPHSVGSHAKSGPSNLPAVRSMELEHY